MIYVSCFLVSVFFAYLAQKSRDKKVMILFSVISILVPSILGGLRANGVGIDTLVYGYQNCMRALRSPDFLTFNKASGTDLGYNIICYSVMKTFGHENWFYFVCMLITISCTYVGAYRHKDKIPLYVTMFVFYFMFYNRSLNVIRQFLSASIIFMNFDKLEKKEYGKFSLWILFASLFHRSAFMVFGVGLAMHMVMTSDEVQKKAWLKFAILISVAVMLAFTRRIMRTALSFVPFLAAKYDVYFDNQYNETGGSTLILLITFGTLLMMLLYRKGAAYTLSGPAEDKSNIEFYKFNLIFCIIFQLAVRFMLNRFLLYSQVFNIFATAAISRFVKEKYLRVITNMILIAVMIFYWWWHYVVKKDSGTWPYVSIL